MSPARLYAALAILGTVLPLAPLAVFVRENGLDVPLLFRQLFAAPAGAFFGMDVIVSSMVLWVFVCLEGRREGLRHLWVPIAANLAVGVSLGLPLFLYMRERRVVTR
jgi:hypothetical protein